METLEKGFVIEHMIPANSANFVFFKNIFYSCLFYLFSININEVSQWKMCSVGDGKEGKEETDCWHLCQTPCLEANRK